jgi:hypothetical protein
MRRWTPGDRLGLRYILSEPRDAFWTYRGRFLCRFLRLHGVSCYGREDHRPVSAVRGRWTRYGAF